MRISSLVAVSAAGPFATRPLELAALGADKRLDAAARGTRGAVLAAGEVLLRLARLARALEQPGVGARRVLERELVEREARAAGLEDPGPGGLGELERADVQLRDGEHPRVIRNRAHDHRDLPGRVLLGHEPANLGDGQGLP